MSRSFLNFCSWEKKQTYCKYALLCARTRKKKKKRKEEDIKMREIGRYIYISQLYKTNSWFLYPVYFVLACLACRASTRWFSTDPLFTRIRETVVEVVDNIGSKPLFFSNSSFHGNFVSSKDGIFDDVSSKILFQSSFVLTSDQILHVPTFLVLKTMCIRV